MPPISQGVSTNGQNRNTWRQAKAVLTAMGVIDDPTALKPPDQTGHIKTPADHPEDLRVRRLITKTVVQIRMIGRSLAIGDKFRLAQIRNESGGLLFNA